MESRLKILRWEDKQNVVYCIPTYLRNEQIRVNMRLVTDRLVPDKGGVTYNPEAIAVVAFGPSLKDTWEKVREFKTVISCSGSHKFLIEHGIIPTYHVEVDPRVHKITLLGDPHPDVQYLPCSAVHPDYLRHLIKHNAKVKLWHVFGIEDASQRIIPKGEWMITGGCDAGLRAVTIARFLGFTNLHLFGFDGSAPEKNGLRHAAAHPNPHRAVSEVEYEGRTFYTTPAMLEAARGLFHELEQLPDVVPTFYGDGLIQYRAKTWVRQNYQPAIIAAIQAPLISDEMLERQRSLHAESPTYGGSGQRWVKVVRDLVESLKKDSVPSVLDYGCGKGFLAEELDFPIWEYDPAIPGKERLPKPADIVVCTDVLEHIEPATLDSVLDDLRRVTRKVGFFSICTAPAFRNFTDGTNVHLIVMPKTWWQMKLAEYFNVGKTLEIPGNQLIFVLGPQQKPKKMVAKTIKVGEKPKGKLDKKSHKKVLEKLVNEHHWTSGAEVGCLQGTTTFHLLENCQDLSLVAVDAWQEYDGLYADAEDGGQMPLRKQGDGTETHVRVPFEVVEELFRDKAKGYNGRLKILKGLSWDMASAVDDHSLDFAFIDADHMEATVRKDIEAWRPKIRPGGMLLGHDVHLPSVRRAVEDLCPGWEHLEQEIWGIHI